ncbi:ninja-family protein AFP3-like [Bidens hawaiensis]|uniref:ninja-family protein AFP3-like n=1 Tax=Bidens hawaiensis TaxID=980011 RepID=UPI00404B48E6
MPGTQNSRDLLPRLTSGSGSNHFPVNPKDELAPADTVELSLGLSLNGRFGLEPQRSVAKTNNNNNNINKLCRASSVVNSPVDVELSLTRTCSLPPETEAEWRKRKELQSLRRSEAKRKRVEKLKNLVDGRELCRRGLKQSPAPALGFSSQGSIGSQESGGSSGVSDLDSQPVPGMNNTRKTNERSELNKLKWNPKIKPANHHAYDETMPCVSTKGEGPDGKRIQGFLYRYGKDEDVRIVCVCHGSFLTPAEFVKHGGGGEVDHPLRHIVVTSLFS